YTMKYLNDNYCLASASVKLRKMPIKPDARVWKALLGICRIHGNLELGTVVVERLIELEPQSSVGYVFLTENAEAPRANKFVITDEYFQRVIQALMIWGTRICPTPSSPSSKAIFICSRPTPSSP
ncbi:hypothetical protein Tco_0535133, partial [Tanacetum coccineum]